MINAQLLRESHDNSSRFVHTGKIMAVAMIKILLSALLPFLLSCGRPRMSAYGQKLCNPLSGQFSLCQCEMSDGSGVIDLSRYANENGASE